jgi:flagella basal body P-ring formation protein FlgA
MRQAMRALSIVPLLLALGAASSPAATLRTMTSLSAPVVLVSDLFDEAGATAGRVLGPAPAPGQHIVVEAAQLAAIARQFGVDWRPASAADRSVLERPGRLLPRDLVLAALSRALAAAGAPTSNEIALSGYDAPMLPLASDPHALVEQLDYQNGSGRFAADVLVSGEAMAPIRLRLSGEVDEVAVIPVPSHRIPAGGIVRAADLVPLRVHVAALRGDVVRDVAQADGMSVRRAAASGQPLPIAELARPAAVGKGASVTLQLVSPGLALSVQGVALQPGAVGERIRVLNPVSRMIVEGDVVGVDHVAVAADSVPVPSDARLAAALGIAQ